MALAIKWEAHAKGESGLLSDAAAAFASAVSGGFIEEAKVWTKKVAEGLQASVEGEQTLLKIITTVTLNELRALQGELSCPPPGGKKYLLRDLVMNGVGGVAKNNMLLKLALATVVRLPRSSHFPHAPLATHVCHMPFSLLTRRPMMTWPYDDVAVR